MKPTDQIKEKLENANSKEETHTQIRPSKFGGSFNQNQTVLMRARHSLLHSPRRKLSET